jgi:hypothetical protein
LTVPVFGLAVGAGLGVLGNHWVIAWIVLTIAGRARVRSAASQQPMSAACERCQNPHHLRRQSVATSDDLGGSSAGCR